MVMYQKKSGGPPGNKEGGGGPNPPRDWTGESPRGGEGGVRALRMTLNRGAPGNENARSIGCEDASHSPVEEENERPTRKVEGRSRRRRSQAGMD